MIILYGESYTMFSQKKRSMLTLHLRKLIICVLITVAAGILISYFAAFRGSFYPEYIKPPLSLEQWAYLPVLTVFYLIVGIAAYAVSDSSSYLAKNALIKLFFSIILSIVWALIFFCAGNAGTSFAVCAACLAAVIYTSFTFYKIDPSAAFLLVPYIMWVCYLLVLNYRIWLLN